MAQSYKIFINDVPLFLTEKEQDTTPNTYPISWTDFETDVSGTMMHIYENRTGMSCVIFCPSVELGLQKIKSSLKVVMAAGGLVYNENNKLLIIYRNNRWDLPKGKMEPGESIEDTATREVTEETGISDLKLLQKLSPTWHIYKDHGQLILKETQWYRMLTTNAEGLKPQKSEGITELVWMAENEIAANAGNLFGSLKDLLQNL